MQDQAPDGHRGRARDPGEDGGVDLYIATQWLHIDQEQMSACLALPLEKVRLHLAGVGGSFGAREDLSMQVQICLLALRTGRPVKMVYSARSHSSVTCTGIPRSCGTATMPTATGAS